MKERDWVDWTSFSNQLAQTRILEQQTRHLGELASIERARLRLEETRAIDEIVERFTNRYLTREVEERFDLVNLLMNRFESCEPIRDRAAFKEHVSTSIGFVSEVRDAAARVLDEINALLVVSLTKESRSTWTTQVTAWTRLASQLAAAADVVDKEEELESAGILEVESSAEQLVRMLESDERNARRFREVQAEVDQRRAVLERFVAKSIAVEAALQGFDASPRALRLVAGLGELRGRASSVLWAARTSRYGVFSPWSIGSLVSVFAGFVTWGAAGVVAPVLSMVGLLKRYRRGARVAWACLLIGVVESIVAWKHDVPGRVSAWITQRIARPAIVKAAATGVVVESHKVVTPVPRMEIDSESPKPESIGRDPGAVIPAAPAVPGAALDATADEQAELWRVLEPADALIATDLNAAIRIAKDAITSVGTSARATSDELWSSHFHHPSPEQLKNLLQGDHKLNQKTPYGIDGHAKRVEQYKDSDPIKAASYMNSIVFLCPEGFDLEAWWVQHCFHMPPELPGVDMTKVCPSIRKGHGKR